MNHPYKTLAIVPALPPEPKPLHQGPRESCPACGIIRRPLKANYATIRWQAIKSRACLGASWLGRLFGGCRRRDLHLHEHCRVCGARWECDPIGDED